MSKSYWQEFHWDKIGNKDFIDGAVAAVSAYSIYRNGKCEIGSPGELAKDVIERIKKDLKYPTEAESELKKNIIERADKVIRKTILSSRDIPYTPELKLVEDLNADSLDNLEIIIALEDEFNIEIHDHIAQKVKTLQDVYNAIAKILHETYPRSSNGS